MDSKNEGLRGATVVAFYGSKEADFAAWISDIQDRVVQLAANSFTPRPITEVHSTILGLERPSRRPTAHGILELFDRLELSLCNDIEVQFGGFEPTYMDFVSRGQSPYDRSFMVNGTSCVVIGWPVQPAGPQARPVSFLADLRRDVEQAGFRHRYHQGAADRDPDLHIVIGSWEAGARDAARVSAIQENLRRYIRMSPFTTLLKASDLSLVMYTDNSLTVDSSIALNLHDAKILSARRRLIKIIDSDSTT